MIKLLKRNALNIKKYDACIEKSIQNRVYAFSWYLDIVAENWDVLVLNDYEALMPLPWKQKYYIKYIAQPFFCQQLGVFSSTEIKKDLFLKFQNAIPKKFVKVSLQLNGENYFKTSNFQQKKNYILPLNTSYKNLFKSFNKGRKHAVRVAKSYQLVIRDISVDTIIEFVKKYYNYMQFSNNDFQKLKEIANYITTTNKGYVVGVFENDEPLGGAILLKDNYRITYLFSAFTTVGKKRQAPSFLIHQFVKQYANTSFIFDYEGSMIPTIASFYKSFGAKEEPYSLFKK